MINLMVAKRWPTFILPGNLLDISMFTVSGVGRYLTCCLVMQKLIMTLQALACYQHI